MVLEVSDQAGTLALDPAFLARIKEMCQEPLELCYQCQKCSSGCPAAQFMDIHPNQLIRYLQYGAKDLVLGSEGIWICLSCETCGLRCPNGINLAKVMDACRQMALEEKKATARRIVVFHKVFLDTVRTQGRMHEIGLLGKYKLMSGHLFNDLVVGVRLFMKGKLAIVPSKLSGQKQITRIFQRTARKQGTAR